MKIIVPTCKDYSKIIPAFRTCFCAVWPDCPYPVSVLYNGIERNVDDDPTWEQEDLGWASNMLLWLENETEPFLLLIDDYLLVGVWGYVVKQAGRLIGTSAIGMVRLTPWPGPTLESAIDGFGEFDKQAPYLLSLQAAMWKPAALRELLRPGESAWQTEIDGTKRAKESRYDFMGTSAGNAAVVYQNYYRHGKAVPDVVEWLYSTYGMRI